MVFATIAMAPGAAVTFLRISREIGEIVPGGTTRCHPPAIAPIVIALAVGRVVHIAYLGAAWMGVIMADEALPEVITAVFVAEDLFHDRLRTVAIRF